MWVRAVLHLLQYVRMHATRLAMHKSSPRLPRPHPRFSHFEYDAIEALGQAGALVVAGAGNDEDDNDVRRGVLGRSGRSVSCLRRYTCEPSV